MSGHKSNSGQVLRCTICKSKNADFRRGVLVCQDIGCLQTAFKLKAEGIGVPLSNPGLVDFVDMSYKVTMANMVALGSTWPTKKQLGKISEEYTELVQALTGNDRDHMLEEAWDIILSTVTLLSLQGFTPKQISNAGCSTLQKVQRRVARRLLEAAK